MWRLTCGKNKQDSDQEGHVFALRQIIEKVMAWQIPVMTNFIDFRKAFDCIHRPSLWLILKQYGIPDSIVCHHSKPVQEQQKLYQAEWDDW